MPPGPRFMKKREAGGTFMQVDFCYEQGRGDFALKIALKW